ARARHPTRPREPALRELFQCLIARGYCDLTGQPAPARGRSAEQIGQVARGRVWSGARAKAGARADELGRLRDAIRSAAERASLGDADWWQVRYVEKPLTPVESFIAGMAESRAGAAVLARSGLAAGLVPAVHGLLADLRFLEEAIARGSQPVKAIAHCFCLP